MGIVDRSPLALNWARATPAFLLITTIVLFALAKQAISLTVDAYPATGLFSASVVLGLLWATYSYQPSAAAFLSRALALVLGFYIAILAPGFAPAPQLPDPSSFLMWCRWLAVACSILAMLRPAFLIVPVLFVVIYKSVAVRHLGFDLSETDYLPLIELGITLWIGQWLVARWSLSQELRAQCLSLLFLGAVAIHFANYFWSGVTKVVIGDGLSTWAVENQTWYLLLVSRELGMLPLSEAVFPAAIGFFKDANVLSNFVILGLQLVALFCCQWRRGIVGLTLAYDVSHLVIYLVSGIFFWKWILLNFAIVIAASRYRISYGWWGNRVLLFIIIIAAGSLFFTTKLGWFDTPSVTHSRLQAEFSNGDRLDLPSNFFLTGSVTAAQQRLGSPHPIGNGTGTWGQTQQLALMRGLKEHCSSMAVEYPGSADREGYWATVLRHHQWLIRRGGSPTIGSLHAYPHHIFSNPNRYERINSRRISDIRAYWLITEVVCFSADGKEREVVKRTEEVRRVSRDQHSVGRS